MSLIEFAIRRPVSVFIFSVAAVVWTLLIVLTVITWPIEYVVFRNDPPMHFFISAWRVIFMVPSIAAFLLAGMIIGPIGLGLVTDPVNIDTIAQLGFILLFTLLLSTLMIPEAVVWIPNFITVTWLGRVGPISWINNWPALTRIR